MKRRSIDLPRSRWLLAVLVGTGFAAAGYWAQSGDPERETRLAVAAATGPMASIAPKDPLPDETAEVEQRPELTDIFAVRTWEPPPPPPAPVVVAPPPPPQAPPLPFRFIGRIEDADGGDTFLLADADSARPFVVGKDIDARYRLEKFEGGQLYFLYRPLNQYQTLSVGTPP